MGREEPVPENAGVTSELLATVDLGPEIEGMAGRLEISVDIVASER